MVKRSLKRVVYARLIRVATVFISLLEMLSGPAALLILMFYSTFITPGVVMFIDGIGG